MFNFKSVSKILTVMGVSFALLSLSALVSCGENSGLGSSVDTANPELTPTYPADSAIVKGSFVFAGTSSDDKGVKTIEINVYGTDSTTPVYTTTTTPEKSGEWSVTLNEYDISNANYYNGWQFADGTYTIKANAKDASGRESGERSKTVSIDNTAPVLILTKPTSVGSQSAKTYGQTVQLQGSFSEMSDGKIEKLIVSFYKLDGTHLLDSTFTDITDMSSANPLVIAQYYSADSSADIKRPTTESDSNWTKWYNYKTLYGDDYIAAYEAYASGASSTAPDSQQFYFTVTAYDEAKTWTNKNDSGVSGGNATATYYRGTTDMLQLIEGKNASFQGFSALSLRNYLNKTDSTYSSDDASKSALDAILVAAQSVSPTTDGGETLSDASIADFVSNTDTESGSKTVYLNFKINPLNNPTYAVSGYGINTDKADGDSYSELDDIENTAAGYRKYYTGSSISISVSPGLDETNIDTSTVSIYLQNTASTSDSDKILVWTWNKDVAIASAMSRFSLSEADATAAIEALSGDSESYRYTPTSSSENTDSLSITTTLEDGITSGKTYKFSVEGYDIDGQSVVPTSTAGYGIWPNADVEPPEVAIGSYVAGSTTNFADDAVINATQATALSFTGTVSSAILLNTSQPMTYTLTLTDASSTYDTLTIEGAPDCSYVSGSTYNYNWRIDITSDNIGASVWSELATRLNAASRYKLALSVVARSAAGKGSDSRSIIIDTKAPSVRGVSITNSVSGTVTDSGETYSISYINGKADSYTISGASSDNYELSKTVYTITGVDSAGSAKEINGTLNDTENWTFAPDLSAFAAQNGVDITVSFSATDAADNTSETTKLYIEFDTTAPVLTEDKIGGTTYSADATASWQKNTTLGVEGSVTEEGSGVKVVYYQITTGADEAEPVGTMTTTNYETAATGKIYTADNGTTETFSSTLTGFESGTNVLSYVIVDNLGNVSSVYERTIKTDATTPTVKELATDDTDYVAFSKQYFGKSAKGFTFRYLIYDADSGINTNSVDVTIGDYTISQTDPTYGTLTVAEQALTVTTTDGKITGIAKAAEGATDTVTGYLVTVVLKDSLDGNITENNLYTVSSSVLDKAGNQTQTTVGIFSIDKTAPVVTVTKVSGSQAYVNGLKDITVTIKESGNINSVTYQIFKKTDTAFDFSSPLSFYESTDASGTLSTTQSDTVIAQQAASTTDTVDSNFTFYIYTKGNNESAFGTSGSFVIRVTATDAAGNANEFLTETEAQQTLTANATSSEYFIDTTPPTFNESAETIGGKAYSASAENWYDSTTLAVSGSVTDVLSGVEAVYYQILTPTVSGDSVTYSDEMTTDDYATKKTGIIYTNATGTDGTRTFNTAIEGFLVSSAANKLVYVVVDNAGNAVKVDARTIYVDNVAPTITASDSGKTVTSNGKSAIAESLTFSVNDAASGIDTSSLSVVINENEITTSTTTFGTLLVGTKSDDGSYLVTLSISQAQAESLVSSSASVTSTPLVSGNSYAVEATVKDKAGKSTTKTIRMIKIDTEAPEVEVTKVDTSDSYVKETKKVISRVSDSAGSAITNVEYAIFASSDTNFDLPLTTVTSSSDGTLAIDSSSTAAAVTKTFTIDISSIYSATEESEKLTHGDSFVVCVRATDSAHNTSEWADGKSSVYTVDTVGPTLDSGYKLGDEVYSSSTWYTATTLTASGSWSDAGSGASKMYYLRSATALDSTNDSDPSYIKENATKSSAIGDDHSFTVNISDFESNGTTYLYYVAEDAAGNLSAEVTPLIVNVDVDKPTFTVSDTIETTTKKKDDTATFTVTVSDGEGSGINETKLVATIGSYSIYADSSVADYNTYGSIEYSNGTVTVTVNSILMSKLNEYKLNSVNVTAYDKAGNSDSATIGYLKVDNTAPKVSITKESGTNLFVKGEKSVTAAITDIGDIQKVEWAVFEYNETSATYDTATAKASGTAFERTDSTTDIGTSATIPANFSSDTFTDGSSYVICVKAKDAAGNESLYSAGVSSTYTVDKHAPTLSGDSVGGSVYETTNGSKNWFKDDTLSVSGTWTDVDTTSAQNEGSGVTTLYYQLNGTTALTKSNYTSADNVETLAVASNKFNTNIGGFVTGENRLIYVAVDAAGNVSDPIIRTIYVDATKPKISELDLSATGYTSFSGTTAMGKVSDIDLYFTVTDADSGLGITSSGDTYSIGDVITATVNTQTISSTYGSLSVTSVSDSVYTIKLTLTASALAGGESPVLANGSSYGVTVKLTDVAGNEAQQSITTLSIDTTAPTVTITAASGSDLYAKDSKTASATLSDANGISSYQYAIFVGDVTVTNSVIDSSATALKAYGALSTSDTSVTPTVKLSESSTTLNNGDTFIIGVKATDSLGNESEYYASSTYTVDTVAPALYTGSNESYKEKIGGTDSYSTTYFNTNSLDIVGYLTESGSGVKTVYYKIGDTLSGTDEDSIKALATGTLGAGSVSDDDGVYTFTGSISGFSEGTNSLSYAVVDYVGNVYVIARTVSVDLTSPTITEDTGDTFSGTVLTNGANGSTVEFSFNASDVEGASSTISGLSSNNTIPNGAITIQVGTLSSKTVTYKTDNGDTTYGTITVSDINDKSYRVQVTLKTDALLSGENGSTYAINATVKDIAGNSYTTTVKSLNVDTTPPVVKVTYPASGGAVNKTITLKGSATDANDIEKLTIKVHDSEASSVSLATDGSWTATFDTTSLHNDTIAHDATVTVIAVDEANNSTTEKQSFSIDQTTDRPVIKISDLELSNGVYYRKMNKSAQISGTLTDDDSGSYYAANLVMSSSAQLTALPKNGSESWTVSENGATLTYTNASHGTTVFNRSTGAWTFTPADTADGEKSVYFYVVDNAGGVFYTHNSTLEQPVIQIGSDETKQTGSSTAFGYTSDSVNPSVQSARVNYSSKSDTVDSNVEAISISTSFVSGGSVANYLQFIITAYDASGIEGMILTLGNSNESELTTLKYATVDDAIALDTSLSGYILSGQMTTDSGTKVSTWETDLISLESFRSYTGSLTLTVTAYDYSGLSGAQSYTFMIDNSLPDTFSVSSPSKTKELSGSSQKITGTSADEGSAGLSKIYYAVPKLNATSIADSEWSSEFDFVAQNTSTWTFTLNVDNYLNRTGATDENEVPTQTYNVTKKSGSVYQQTDIWTIPIYFKLVDKLGNSKVYGKDSSNNYYYYITYNPNADLPITTITYPNSDNYVSDSDNYVTVGGKIKVQGSSSFGSGFTQSDTAPVTLNYVFLQIGLRKATYTTTDNTNYTVTLTDEVNWNYSDTEEYQKYISLSVDSATSGNLIPVTVNTLASNLNLAENEFIFASASTSDIYSSASNWWGIQVGDEKNTADAFTWTITLNENGGLNTTLNDKVNRIAIRACTVNSKGKVGTWSGPYFLHVDQGVPTQTAKLAQYTSLSEISGDVLYAATADAEKEYISGAYIRNPDNDWYLVVTAVDAQGIVESGDNGISLDGNLHSTYYAHKLVSGDADYTETDSDSHCNYVIFIPLSVTTVDGSANTKFVLAVTDNDEDSKHTTQETYSINIDNAAPVMDVIKTKGTNGTAIDKTKMRNSDYYTSIGSTATDGASGFSKLAYYFKRTVVGTTTIELPTPSYSWNGTDSTVASGEGSALVAEVSGSIVIPTSGVVYSSKNASYPLVAQNDDEESNDSMLYGVWLNEGARSSTTSFYHALISDYADIGLIRTGGIVRIAGSYVRIESIDGDTITLSESVTTSATKAFFAMAFIVDNTNAESTTWSGKTQTIGGDDGDGIAETVKTSGSTATWDTSFFSDELDDGAVTIVCAAFDSAGNVATKNATVMFTNNTPRLSKVYLATDLNGNGTFTDNELGMSYISNGDTASVYKYYGALSNGTSGSLQEIVTLKGVKSASATANLTDTGIIMRNDLGVALEFVGGSTYEGYGSGNGDLYYKLSVSQEALAGSESGTTAKISSMADYFDSTSGTVTATARSLNGLYIKTTDITGGTYGTYQEYVSDVEATANSGTATAPLNYIRLTLWDSTKGTTPGTGDGAKTTTDGVTTYESFGSQFTVLNIPLYMDLVDGAKPVPAFTELAAQSTTTGHVDLNATLPTANFKESSGEFDADSKASGIVVFTGTVTDEKRVSSIKLTTNNGFGSSSATALTEKEVATYDTTSGTFMVTETPAAGLTFSITQNEFTTVDGHTVGWKLIVDTSKVTTVAATDVKFTITASDGTNTNTDAYQIDIVPYITGITSSNEKLYRSTYGEYSVYSGDTLTVTGYNFSTSPTVRMGANKTTAPTVTNAAMKSFNMTVPSYSGELYVTVNGIVTLNDKNNNANTNNQETKTDDSSTVHSYWYDNRYLRVWDINHYFKDGDADAHKPVMVADYDGNLFGAWTRMGDGQVIVQRTADATGTRVLQHYDQTGEFSAIAVDTKSSSKGTISVLNFNENVGNGGKMTSNAFSDVSNCGGAWGIAIDNALSATNESIYSTVAKNNLPMITVAGNPKTFLDNTWGTSGYQLASYAMLRDVGKFSTPRTARYGDQMHFVYYDSKDQSLRYTTVESGSDSNYYARYVNNTTQSWVLIDGTVNAYDRVHDYKANTAENDFVHNDTVVNNTSNDGTLSLTLTGMQYDATNKRIQSTEVNSAIRETAKVSSTETAGIAITYTTSAGTRRVLVIDDCYPWNNNNRYVGLGRALTSAEQSVITDDTTYTEKHLTIYKGNKNVLTENDNGGAAQASAAGKFSSIDVIGSGLTGEGKPVIVYYDGTHTRLRIAYATATAPSSASDWVRKDVTYTEDGSTKYASGGSHCALKIDNSGNLHIIYRSKSNDLMYIKGTGNPTSGYTFGTPLLIDDDTTGTWGTISLRNGTTPVVAYLNSEESEEGVKVAIFRTVDEGTAYTDEEGNAISEPSQTNTAAFDTMIMPLASGYNVVGENLVCIEANNGSWNSTHTEAGVTVSECEAAVSYQSTRLDLSFLKSEQ